MLTQTLSKYNIISYQHVCTGSPLCVHHVRVKWFHIYVHTRHMCQPSSIKILGHKFMEFCMDFFRSCLFCVSICCARTQSNPFELNRTFEDIVLNLAATREMTMNFVAVVLLRFDCDSLSKWHTIKRLKFFCESFSKFVSLHNNQAVHWVENAKCQYIDWRDDAFSERAVIFDISLVQTSYWCVYAYLNLRSPTKWTFF